MEILGLLFVLTAGAVSFLLPTGPMFTGAEEARRERSRLKSQRKREEGY